MLIVILLTHVAASDISARDVLFSYLYLTIAVIFLSVATNKRISYNVRLYFKYPSSEQVILQSLYISLLIWAYFVVNICFIQKALIYLLWNRPHIVS